MITTLKNSEIGITQLDEITSGCWIHVVDPSPDEIAHLQEVGIPHDYLAYPLDLDERARTERENGSLLIILRIPVFQGQNSDIPYTTIPLGIIITDKYLVTVCKQENDILQEFASGRVRGLSVVKRNRFILRLFLNTANKYLHYVREINKTVEALEDQLQLNSQIHTNCQVPEIRFHHSAQIE
jgi:magnesium transporter